MLKLAELYAATAEYTRPDYVKKASAEDFGVGFPAGRDQVPKIGNEYFPIHTRAAVWASAARLLQKRAVATHAPEREQLNEASLAIEKRAQYFGIDGDLRKLVAEYVFQLTPSREGDEGMRNEDYAYVRKTAGEEIREYPIKKEADVRAAAEYLQKYADSFSLPERRMMSRRILLKSGNLAMEFDSDTQYFLEKQAGQGTCSTEAAADLLRTRSEVWRKNLTPFQLTTKLAQLIEHVANTPQTEVGAMNLERDKLAEFIDHWDTEFEVKHRYGKDIERPEDVLFSVTRSKLAEARNNLVQTQAGEMFDRRDLAKLDYDKVAAAIGEDWADACVKNGSFDHNELADLIPTIPRPDMAQLSTLIKSAGVQPVAYAPEARPARRTTAEWLALCHSVSTQNP